MRTLTFTQIADSRSVDDIVSEINRIKNGLIEALEILPDVSFRYLNQRQLNWDDGSKQLRITIHVQKHSRRTTWNDIYAAVNSVKAAHYKFIQTGDIREIKKSPYFQQL